MYEIITFFTIGVVSHEVCKIREKVLDKMNDKIADEIVEKSNSFLENIKYLSYYKHRDAKLIKNHVYTKFYPHLKRYDDRYIIPDDAQLEPIERKCLNMYLKDIEKYMENQGLGNTGLLEYAPKDMKKFIKSMIPKLVIRNHELMLDIELETWGKLDKQETYDVLSYISGQLTDGWGEGFEQFPIKIDTGNLFLSFYDINYDINEVNIELEFCEYI